MHVRYVWKGSSVKTPYFRSFLIGNRQGVEGPM